MQLVLGPDVYVNASVAPGTEPEQVTKLVLGSSRHVVFATPWILDRVRGILAEVPAFRSDRLDPHMRLIESLVRVVKPAQTFPVDRWADALAAAAKTAGVKLAVTDHPDLLALASQDGVELLSTAKLLSQLRSPPPPPVR